MAEKVIYKWMLPSANVQAEPTELELPYGTALLGCGDQDGQLVMWGICDPAKPRERRRFLVLVTGQFFSVPSDQVLRYLSSVQTTTSMAEYFVEHVFEVESADKTYPLRAEGE